MKTCLKQAFLKLRLGNTWNTWNVFGLKCTKKLGKPGKPNKTNIFEATTWQYLEYLECN